MRSVLSLLPLWVATTSAAAAAAPKYPYQDMPEVIPDTYITHNRHITLQKRDDASGVLANKLVFEHAATQSRLQYVNNSGICETTPGVNQYSGYINVGTNMKMWFWMFEARKDSENAPLVAWFNGGPGCSSMIGLFQEHGPCQFYDGASEPSLNKYSFNEYANMIYIDQPIGSGFSYGSSSTGSSAQASPYVWSLLQSVLDAFPKYKSRDFGIFTESYGGHYGPEFAQYILSQNAKIDAGTVQGQKINIKALGVNNAWINPGDNYKGLIDYSATNTYKPMISKAQQQSYTNTYTQRCEPLLQACWKSNSNTDCTRALQTCKTYIQSPLIRAADFNVYDVRAVSAMQDLDPPPTYNKYLARTDIKAKIGAESNFVECSNPVASRFAATGDDSRDFAPAIAKALAANVTVLIWDGDTDWICNWMANLATANKLDWTGKTAFAAKSLEPYTVNGVEKGQYKKEGNLAFLKVKKAGHMLMYYQPETALQAFMQTMEGGGVVST